VSTPDQVFEQEYGLVALDASEFQLQGLALIRPRYVRRNVIQELSPHIDRAALTAAANAHPQAAWWVSAHLPHDDRSSIEKLKPIIEQEALELLRIRGELRARGQWSPPDRDELTDC
jgi:hypothetical protein